MTATVDEVAAALDEIANWTRLTEGIDSFRVRAWREAARAVRRLGDPVLTMDVGGLRDVEGLGKASVEVIDQVRSGTAVPRLEKLRAAHPPGMLELLRVPGLGPSLVRALHDVLGIDSVADLKAALDDGRLAELPGMGPTTIEGLRDVLHVQGGRPLPLADVLEALGPARVVPSDLDLTAEALSEPAPLLAGAARRGEDHLGEVVVVGGPNEATTVTALTVAVRHVPIAPGRAGWDLIRATGPDEHVGRLVARAGDLGLEIDDDGLRSADGGRVATPDEAAVYAALGLHPVPPERRHLGEAIVPADQPPPATLVTADEIRGDLHVHTTWSGDGRSSMSAMLTGVAAAGLDYVAITDHAEDLRINGLDRAQMLDQRAEVRRHEARLSGLRVLHGAELNIARDGDLDYDADFRSGFQWCVASVHSAFRLSRADQTARLVRAIHDPAVTAVGHLTGRMLGRRRGIDLDLEAVFAALRDTGTALEINCSPRRLDAPADIAEQAAASGVHLVISTDSHHVDALANLAHGVRLARRAGVAAEQVVNTWPLDRFLAWVDDVRSAA